MIEQSFHAVNQVSKPRIIPGLFLCPPTAVSVFLQNEFQSCACYDCENQEKDLEFEK